MTDPENKAGMLMRSLFDITLDVERMCASSTEREFIKREIPELEYVRDRLSRAIDVLRGMR